MEGLPILFSDLYNKFILRDFAGKIVPGMILLYSVGAMFIGQKDTCQIVRKISPVVTALIAGAAWSMMLGLQAFSEVAGIWKYFPTSGSTEPEFIQKTIRIVQFQWCATDIELLQYERFVVIKEATGNLLTVALLSIPCHLFLWAGHLAKGIYERKAMQNLKSCYLAFLVCILLFGLAKMNSQHVERQFQYADKVASLREGEPTKCWQKGQTTGRLKTESSK